MAPAKAVAASSSFAKDERVLCFHHEMLYEAKVRDVRPTEDSTSYQYLIHYKGWKATWDDWVPQDRVRKFDDDNKELAAQLHQQMKAAHAKAPSKMAAKAGGKGARANGGSDFSSIRGSEERQASAATQGGRGGPRRGRDYENETEEQFHNRPSIQIVVPDHIKAVLVDDWENVTKNNQLVPTPNANPVNKILDDYLAVERPKRQAGSAQADVLDEVMAGLREYFEKCLGRILLYKFERKQYSEMHKLLEKENAKKGTKTMGDIYGVEHLCRLLVTLPELVAQTNMDANAINRLREEMNTFTQWLGKVTLESGYFTREYESPGAEYKKEAENFTK